MKICVCVKQVPDTADVKIDPVTNTLVREGVESVMNPFDLFAVEETVRLGGRTGAQTMSLTMGPPQAEAVLREAISLGVENGVLVCGREFAGADTWATSYALAKAVEKSGASLVLCGKQASDGDTAQVGPGIAAHLKWPQLCYVTKIVEISEKSAVVERMLDHGREIVEIMLPAVITVVKEINVPRLPDLPGVLKARSATITCWSAADIGAVAEDIGLSGSPTEVRRIFSPPCREGGDVVSEGSPSEKASVIAEFISALNLG